MSSPHRRPPGKSQSLKEDPMCLKKTIAVRKNPDGTSSKVYAIRKFVPTPSGPYPELEGIRLDLTFPPNPPGVLRGGVRRDSFGSSPERNRTGNGACLLENPETFGTSRRSFDYPSNRPPGPVNPYSNMDVGPPSRPINRYERFGDDDKLIVYGMGPPKSQGPACPNPLANRSVPLPEKEKRGIDRSYPEAQIRTGAYKDPRYAQREPSYDTPKIFAMTPPEIYGSDNSSPRQRRSFSPQCVSTPNASRRESSTAGIRGNSQEISCPSTVTPPSSRSYEPSSMRYADMSSSIPGSPLRLIGPNRHRLDHSLPHSSTYGSGNSSYGSDLLNVLDSPRHASNPGSSSFPRIQEMADLVADEHVPGGYLDVPQVGHLSTPPPPSRYLAAPQVGHLSTPPPPSRYLAAPQVEHLSTPPPPSRYLAAPQVEHLSTPPPPSRYLPVPQAGHVSTPPPPLAMPSCSYQGHPSMQNVGHQSQSVRAIPQQSYASPTSAPPRFPNSLRALHLSLRNDGSGRTGEIVEDNFRSQSAIGGSNICAVRNVLSGDIDPFKQFNDYVQLERMQLPEYAPGPSIRDVCGETPSITDESSAAAACNTGMPRVKSNLNARDANETLDAMIDTTIKGFNKLAETLKSRRPMRCIMELPDDRDKLNRLLQDSIMQTESNLSNLRKSMQDTLVEMTKIIAKRTNLQVPEMSNLICNFKSPPCPQGLPAEKDRTQTDEADKTPEPEPAENAGDEERNEEEEQQEQQEEE